MSSPYKFNEYDCGAQQVNEQNTKDSRKNKLPFSRTAIFVEIKARSAGHSPAERDLWDTSEGIREREQAKKITLFWILISYIQLIIPDYDLSGAHVWQNLYSSLAASFLH
jgi:hypothetical protein